MRQVKVLICRDAIGRAAEANAARALQQARIAFETADAKEPLPPLDRFAAILLAVHDLWALDLEALRAFVAGGGGIVAIHGWADGAWDLFGIEPPRSGPGHVWSGHMSEGIAFSSGLLPSFAGLALGPARVGSHSSFDVAPVRDAEIVARTSVGRPLAWRVRRGRGYVLYWNSVILAEREWRGLIVESLAAVLPVAVTPRVNAAVIHADDFPAPQPGALSVGRRFGGPGPMAPGFFARTWLPEVRALVARHGFAMTSFAVFSYTWRGEDRAPPRSEDRRRDLFAAFRAAGGEVGLHGLNHSPLLLRHWGGRRAMADGLRRAMALWAEQGLGPPPQTYVPPNNEYDREGAAALREAVPSVGVICGSADGEDFERGIGREPGPEPFAPDLFALPRMTSGHGALPETLSWAVSQVAATGMWTHFLHPDDIADLPRPGEAPFARRNPHASAWGGSGGMRADLDRLLREVRRRFPWLRGRSTVETAARVREHLAARWAVHTWEGGVRIEGPPGGTCEIRLNGAPPPALGGLAGARVLHQDEGAGFRRLVVELEEGVATLETCAAAAEPA